MDLGPEPATRLRGLQLPTLGDSSSSSSRKVLDGRDDFSEVSIGWNPSDSGAGDDRVTEGESSHQYLGERKAGGIIGGEHINPNLIRVLCPCPSLAISVH